MKFKRIRSTLQKIAMILAIATTAVQLSSCGLIIINDMSGTRGSETEASENEAANSSAEPVGFTEYTKYTAEDAHAVSERYLDDLPARDYEGAIFFITTPSEDYISPEDNASAVSRLVTERNAYIEERYGVTLITSVADAGTMNTALASAVAADTYYTDLLMIPVYMIGQFRAANTLINMRTLPFFNAEQPYFNKTSSDMTSGGYSTYGIAGQASISPSSFSAMFMNKALLSEAGIDAYDIYDSVNDKKWTWDKALAAAEAVRTLNADRADDGLPEYYTFTAQNTADRLADLIFISSGNNYVLTGKRAVPTIGYSANSAKKTMRTLNSIFNDPSAIRDSSAGAVKCFSTGESAFLVDYLYIMPWMTNSAADWGIVPLPMENEAINGVDEGYRTLIANTELVFAVPKNHTNGEFPAIILSALNAASYGYIYDEYVDYNLINSLRDNASANMLDLILDTAYFDFALAFGNAYPTIADATYRLIRACAGNEELAERLPPAKETAVETMKKYFPLKH